MIGFILTPKNSGLEKYKDLALSLMDTKNSKIIRVRGEDIPFLVDELIGKGKEVMGLTGEDLYKDYCIQKGKTDSKIIRKIEWDDGDALFGKPTLSFLGPKNKQLENMPKNLSVCISSGYKNIAEKYLKSLESIGFNFKKIFLNGCVELAYSEGIADVIIDIVYTGSSMEESGLKIFDKVMESDFLIIGGPNA